MSRISMNNRKLIPLFLLALSLSGFALASWAQSPQLSLENIYSNRAFAQKGFGPVRWMKDSKGYSTVERNKELGGGEIIRYDAQSGDRTVLVSAKQLIPTGSKEPITIEDYTWSDDNTQLLVFTNTKKVWRYNTASSRCTHEYFR